MTRSTVFRRPSARSAALAFTVVLAVTGCGGGDDPTVGGQAAATPPPQPPQTQPAQSEQPSLQGCVDTPPTAPVPTGATTEVSQKPVIPASSTPPPCDLQSIDIVPGSGLEAKTGDRVKMKYVGVLYETGQEFDSSWSRGPQETFDFTLGEGRVIPGWDEGIVGMKLGGRRQLVLPPSQGYGEQGSPPDIPPNATLVFVVDLIKVN